MFDKMEKVFVKNNYLTLEVLCIPTALQVKNVLWENIGFQNKYGQHRERKCGKKMYVCQKYILSIWNVMV